MVCARVRVVVAGDPANWVVMDVSTLCVSVHQSERVRQAGPPRRSWSSARPPPASADQPAHNRQQHGPNIKLRRSGRLGLGKKHRGWRLIFQ